MVHLEDRPRPELGRLFLVISWHVAACATAASPQFIRLVGCEDRIVEYNQEQCRVNSYDGCSSLIRSFPSKVGERNAANRTFL